MTRKHFNEIARAIHERIPDSETRRKLAEGLCIFFKQQNERFQADRFIRACEEGIGK